MMTIKRLASLVFAIIVSVTALEAATPSKFRPAAASEPEIGRYVITVTDATDDIAAMKQQVTVLYDASIEADPSAGVRQFAVTMTPARARLLSADPRVVEVAEVRETAPVPPSAASVRHFAPHVLGYGDNGQSGTYTYDSAGNITAIGADTYRYDPEGRLKESVTRGVTETYTYDAFGNRKSAVGATNCLGQSTCATTVTVEPATNHLTNSGVSYDAAGNMTATNGGVYTYDGTGMMIQATVGSDDRQFVYTADDERIAIRQGVSWTWTVRDPGAKVLREFTSLENTPGVIASMTNRQWLKDNVWRDGLLLATTTSTTTLHYHLDHLGTPRLITDANHIKVAEHAYYPFGAEIALTPHESIEEAMKFTGHERDIVAGDGHTLDDMHARYYNASAGRFLEVDPVDGDPRNPQSWNRYSYVQDNPLRFSDPTGRQVAQTIEVGAFTISVVILTVYIEGPSRGVPGKTNGQVLLGSLVDAFRAIRRTVGAMIPGKEPTHLPAPPPPAALPSTGTHTTQPTTGINPTAPTQASGERNPAQDKKLTNGDIKILEGSGIDVHELKGGTHTGQLDLYKDTAGNVYIKPKGGKGPGEETGHNLNDLKSQQ
jgi:RHS repeat-associated protein